jgi:uncharacterized BrkB/YihY/UPF0761 family membrane protein
VHRFGRAVAAFWRKAYEDNLTGLASMVAYSLLLSIFPLALIALFVAGRVLRSHELAAEGVRKLEHASTTVGLVALVSSVWVSTSFWGALDTAFCRIYRLPCRSWVRQKLFGLGMLVVVLVLIAASVAVPAFQAVLVNGAKNLPFGLDKVQGLVYGLSVLISLVVLFVALCMTYFLVPKGKIPWSCVWPGALGATVAMGVVDFAFPLYAANSSTLRIGAAAVFVVIGLVWFYVLALILLSGAVVNDLRLAKRDQPRGARPADAP